jgi:hypothetical protein
MAAIALTAAHADNLPLKVTGDTVTVVRSFPVTITAPEGKGAVKWRLPDGVKGMPDPSRKHVLTLTAAPKGTHVITLERYRHDKEKDDIVIDEGQTTIVVGDVPGPAPEPGPTPTPIPPPTPTDVPFSGITPIGLRVMIVEESALRGKLLAGQISIIQGKRVRDYLDSKCPPGPDGKQREYWILDQNDDVSGLAQHWQDAMKRAKDKSGGKLPWLLVGNGKEGHEGELPRTVDEMLALLKKYGEPAPPKTLEK